MVDGGDGDGAMIVGDSDKGPDIGLESYGEEMSILMEVKLSAVSRIPPVGNASFTKLSCRYRESWVEEKE